MAKLEGQYPVCHTCRVLGAPPSGYYRWQKREQGERAREDRRLKQQILEIHAKTKQRYGTPRVEQALRRDGVRTSRRRVARLRRELGLEAKAAKKHKATTDSNHGRAVAPNRLERNFSTSAPDSIWVGDITYLRTLEGWLYLAVVLDTFSRRIVGWAVSRRLERELAVTALQRALDARCPAPGLIHHTDRGSQYASRDYGDLVKMAGLVFSMSRRGDCWDNAMAESFFKTLKVELGDCFPSRRAAYRELFEYIEGFYNTWRLHSSLGYLSPTEFERLHALQEAA